MLDMKKVAWFELHRQQQHQVFAQRSQNQHSPQNQRGNADRNATGNAFQSQSNPYPNSNSIRQGQHNQFNPISQPFGQQPQYGQHRQQQPFRPSNSFGQKFLPPTAVRLSTKSAIRCPATARHESEAVLWWSAKHVRFDKPAAATGRSKVRKSKHRKSSISAEFQA